MSSFSGNYSTCFVFKMWFPYTILYEAATGQTKEVGQSGGDNTGGGCDGEVGDSGGAAGKKRKRKKKTTSEGPSSGQGDVLPLITNPTGNCITCQFIFM